MSSTTTATPVVTTLDFAEFVATQQRSCSYFQPNTHDVVRKEIVEQTPSWVAAFVKLHDRCDAITLTGTRGNKFWNQDVHDAVLKALKRHRNTAGKKVNLVLA
jgi:hypothetical protein